MNENAKTRQEELIRRFTGIRAAVLGYIRVLVRDIHLAEDLFQEMSIIIMNKAGEFDPSKGEFDSWVRGIARNLARNALRKEKYIHLMPAPELAEAIEQTYEGADPNETGKMSLRLRFLDACLKQISSAAKKLLKLRYREGRSLFEISERTGRTSGAVQVALSRTRDTLLKCIDARERMEAHE